MVLMSYISFIKKNYEDAKLKVVVNVAKYGLLFLMMKSKHSFGNKPLPSNTYTHNLRLKRKKKPQD